MGRLTTRVPRVRFDTARGQVTQRPDTIVVEEPLEIRVEGESVATTMRTPGDDFDLALGHLLTEGLLTDPDAITGMMHCTDVGPDGSPTFNVVDVTLRGGQTLVTPPRERTETMTSACGVCGSRTIDDVRTRSRYAVSADPLQLPPPTVVTWPHRLRARQSAFERTGGSHAAALVVGDDLIAVREDIGRHNAVDKVIGAVARNRVAPLTGMALVVSARASFEIVQKALMVGIPAVVAVGAASSLAVELADAGGITLIGFTRDATFSAYTHTQRLVQPSGL